MTEPTDSLVEIVARAVKKAHGGFLSDHDAMQVAQAVLTALSEAEPTEAMMQAVDAHCSGPVAQWAWRAMLVAAVEHSHGE